MVDVIEEHSHLSRNALFLDKFFSRYKLFASNSERSVRAIGTLRDNRTSGPDKLLITTKEMKKRPRGAFDYRSNGRGQVHVCKWSDDSVVRAGSNYATRILVDKGKRRVKGLSNAKVKQSYLIAIYNEGMRGIYLLDQLPGSYLPQVHVVRSGHGSSL